jgi:uncharacterized SAM-binding protein YcdF (DUF218 family)
VAILKSRLFRRLAPAVVVALVILSHPLWLASLGRFLVRADEPFPSDMVVLLAGDGWGYRLRRAADLVREGYAPKVLVSGPAGMYGLHESDLAIPYAIKLGYPAEWFIPLPHQATSTREEARTVLAELARRRVRRFMVVTSNYHSRRAGGLYRGQAPQAEVRVVAALDPQFSPDAWWHSRTGRKLFLMEWQKTVATWLGM